jgi:hypothetical protein
VLDENGEIRAEAAAAFSEENETNVAKISWLSRKDGRCSKTLVTPDSPPA